MNEPIYPTKLNIKLIYDNDYPYITEREREKSFILLKKLSEKEYEIFTREGNHEILNLDKYTNNGWKILNIEEVKIDREFKQKMVVDLLLSYSNKRNQMIKIENMVDYLNKL